MQLEFESTTDDIIAFNLHQAERSAVTRRDLWTWRIITTVLAMAFAGGLTLLTPGYFSWVLLGAVLAAGLTVFLLYPVLIRRATISTLRRMLKEGNNDAILGRQSLRLAADGIHATNRSGESTIIWSAVQDVSEDARRFFLHISSMSALIIPKSSFRSEEEQRRFLELVSTFRATT